MKNFFKRHSLVIGIFLMFLYTWTIDLSNSGVLPFKVPFVFAITLGWGFIFVSVFMMWATWAAPHLPRVVAHSGNIA